MLPDVIQTLIFFSGGCPRLPRCSVWSWFQIVSRVWRTAAVVQVATLRAPGRTTRITWRTLPCMQQGPKMSWFLSSIQGVFRSPRWVRPCLHSLLLYLCLPGHEFALACVCRLVVFVGYHTHMNNPYVYMIPPHPTQHVFRGTHSTVSDTSVSSTRSWQ